MSDLARGDELAQRRHRLLDVRTKNAEHATIRAIFGEALARIILVVAARVEIERKR